MSPNRLPPYVSENDKVILYDGVCKLCNAWSNFIMRYDHTRTFKLCSVQSPEGQTILRHFGMPTDFYDSMLLVSGRRCFKKSEAFFRVVAKLGYPWKMAYIFRVFPQSIRDWIYDKIALNRYRLFGKYDYCAFPTPDHKARFLNAK